jgi:hypothetical protein
MTETTPTLNSIFKEWAFSFPEFGKYGSKQLLKVNGPVAIGIDLFKVFPTTYRPEFILINLMDLTYSKPLNIIHQYMYGKNHVHIQIRFDKHQSLFNSATQAMREQAIIQVNSSPTINEIIKGIITFLNGDYMIGANSFLQYKAVIMLSKLLGDERQRSEYFAIALKGLHTLPRNVLDAETNGFEKWLEELKAIEPKQILDNVQKNIERWKMSSLPSCGSLSEIL